MAQIAQSELDARALSRALWRKSWLLIGLAILAAIATYAYFSTVTPLYTAETSILIEERESPLTRSDPGPGNASQYDESAIQSQVEVLRSRDIAAAVVDRLDLERRPDFDPATNPSLVQSLLVMVGLREHPVEDSVRQRVMEAYFERLSVYRLTGSRVIGVAFEAPDPELAAEVANAIAEAFVDIQQQAKRESAVAATVWLEQEIDRLRERVAETEQAVADYRTGAGLFYPGASGNLSTQQLGEINAELARAKAARAEAEARSELIQSLLADGGLESSTEVLNSELIQRLRERQVGLETQIAELSTTLLPGHPRIRSLQGQVNNLGGQIREEAERVLASLSTAARVAAAREQSLTTSLNETAAAASASGDQEIELRALEREAASQRNLLETFLVRYREAVARTDANYLPADARVISRAVPSRNPSYPKTTMMSLAAAIAAFLLAAAIVLIREFTSGRAFRILDGGISLAPIAPLALPAARTATVAPAAFATAVHDRRETAPPIVDQPSAADNTEAGGPGAASTAGDAHPSEGETEAVITAAAPEETEAVVTEAAAAPGDTEADADAVPAFAVGSEVEAPPETADADLPLASPILVAATEPEPPENAELLEMLKSPAIRTILFAGAEGGEGAGDIAFVAAREAAGDHRRFILIDLGRVPSEALGGYEEPGLSDLLVGEAAFGEVIRRHDTARIHMIPMGAADRDAPMQRLQLVIGALSHSYDKVLLVADSLDDWPHDHVRPDLAAIVCRPATEEAVGAERVATALERGAGNALIVPYSGGGQGDHGGSGEKASAAA